MRILFAGTPALAVPSLQVAARVLEVVAVLTAPDRPSGRGRAPVASPLAESARALSLPLLQPESLDAAFLDQVRPLRPDLLVVAAYGRIFRKELLSLFPLGGINVHPSLLPRHRGPSPIAAAILAGDLETGVTIQRIALKVDTGDILAQSRRPLRGDETARSLTEELAREGADLLAGVLAAMADGREPPARAQEEQLASYCHTFTKDAGRVDWSMPAASIERRVRAFDPWPRAWTLLGEETLLLLKSRVHAGTLDVDAAGGAPGEVVAADPKRGLLVRTGDGILSIESVQPQFRRAQDWRSFVNGRPGLAGSRLGGGP